MERLRGIIRTAIGYDDARGDLLEVHNVAFENDDTLAEVQAIDQADRMNLLLQIGNRVGQVLVILLIALLIRNFYRKTTGAIQTHARSIQDRRVQEAAIMAVPSEDEKYFRMQEEIAQLVHQRPEEISQLIRTWLKED
jgi:flagellar M-ring protein FliF